MVESISAVRYAQIRERVVWMTWGTAAAEVDVPGERRGRRISIEHRHGDVAQSGEEVNAAGIGLQHQGIVTKGQMMSAVVKDVERDLGRCVGIDATVQTPLMIGV